MAAGHLASDSSPQPSITWVSLLLLRRFSSCQFAHPRPVYLISARSSTRVLSFIDQTKNEDGTPLGQSRIARPPTSCAIISLFLFFGFSDFECNNFLIFIFPPPVFMRNNFIFFYFCFLWLRAQSYFIFISASSVFACNFFSFLVFLLLSSSSIIFLISFLLPPSSCAMIFFVYSCFLLGKAFLF